MLAPTGCRTAPADQVVALYLRLSPRPDDKYAGIPRQLRRGRAYAGERWPGRPVRVYKDEALTAARDDVYREGYEDLKADIAAGGVAHVWTVEQSRISRTMEWFNYVEVCEEAGITELHTDPEHEGVLVLDSEGADSGAVRSRREVKKLKKRVKIALTDKARRGEPGPTLAYGYARATMPNPDFDPEIDDEDEKDVKTWVIVPEEQEIILECAERILAGSSQGSVAADLERRGITGSRGGNMTVHVVRRILTTAAVAGKRKFHDQLFPGNWPAILDEDTWETLRSILGNPRTVQRSDGVSYPVSARFASSSKARRYLLTGGLAVCGVCGAALIGSLKWRPKKADPAPYLSCHTQNGGGGCVGSVLLPVEELVVAQMFAELDKPEFLARLNGVDEGAARRTELVAALSTVANRRKKLATLWAEESLSDEEWAVARAGLDERERAARAELAAVPVASPALDVAVLRELWDDPEGMTLDERRAIIRRVIGKVVLNPGRPGLRQFDPSRVVVEPVFTVA